jgi:hypothetical protein
MYRTGDAGRVRADGNFEFLGRVDHQIKVRGYRIEPAEVEARLCEHPAIHQAVVVGRGEVGVRHLAAFVVPASGVPMPGLQALRRFLADKLPEYMVPSVVVRLSAMPIDANGKLDRKALPTPLAEDLLDDDGPSEEPRTALELVLARTWSEVLEMERVGVHEDFFQVGGSSIAAMRLAGRLRDRLQIDVPLKLIFAARTVAELGRELALREGDRVRRAAEAQLGAGEVVE